jgi:hypothetical protein
MDVLIVNPGYGVDRDHIGRIADSDETAAANFKEADFGLSLVEHQAFDLADFLATEVKNIEPADVLTGIRDSQCGVAKFDQAPCLHISHELIPSWARTRWIALKAHEPVAHTAAIYRSD